MQTPNADVTDRRRLAASFATVPLALLSALAIVFVVTLIASGVLVVIIEAMQVRDLSVALGWAARRRTEFLLSVGLVQIGLLAGIGVAGRIFRGVLIGSLLFLLLALSGHVTQVLLGRNVYPWDLFLHQEVGNLVPVVWDKAEPIALLGVAFLFLLVPFVARERMGIKLGWGLRGLALALALTLISVLSPKPSTALRPFGVRHIQWNQNANYRSNGFILAFVLNTSSLAVETPDDYSERTIQKLLADLPPKDTPAPASRPNANLLVIMSESFFDATSLPGVRFNTDPIPNLRRLMKAHPSGSLYPPVYGGGTSNTEFELLTGHTIRFLSPGALPYQQYIAGPHPSLASRLAERGYRTLAIHPYHAWFWDRDSVYPRLGFDAFVSIEDMQGAPTSGKYISDAVVTDLMIGAYEESPGDSLFAFAVTMEGHGPYPADRYDAQDIQLTSDALSKDQLAELRTYVQGTHHADRELGRLVDYFSKVEEPTIIVFFGDHLPLLAPIFEATGAISSRTAPLPEDRAFLYRVPLLIWSNFEEGHRDIGALSPSFLMPLLLEMMGGDTDPYIDFLQSVYAEIPVFTPANIADAGGSVHQVPPSRTEELLRRWRLLQHDLLFGSQFQLKNHVNQSTSLASDEGN